MTPHFILDYETIGQDVFTVPVVNCSYYTFDWDRFTGDNPYTFEELIAEIKFAKFDIQKQVKEDKAKFKKDDLNWWMEQGEEAKKQLAPSPNDITTKEFCDRLVKYLEGTRVFRWWSRSNTFDPILLHRNFGDNGMRADLDAALPYWLIRDIRTYIDTQFAFKNKKNGFCPYDDENEWNKVFVAHNSIHDVAADILRLQRIERAINC